MKRQPGFSYVVVMFLVATLSVVAARALENSLMVERRSKEAQLLRIGKAYRDAIRTYYMNTPGTGKTLPKSVNDLLLDQRANKIMRPLRKLYRDPITGSANWGYVYKNGSLVGVYSLSMLRPLKQDGFVDEQISFRNAVSYQNWQFIYDPVSN